MATNLRILIVASDIPFPATHGGRRAVLEHAVGLKQLAHTLDLVATVKDDVPESDILELKRTFTDITIVKRMRNLGSMISIDSFQVASRAALGHVALKQNYDIIVLESPHVMRILDNPKLSFKRLFFRVHNDEVKYFQNLKESTSNMLIKLFYKLESIRIRRAQTRCLKDADTSLFISQSEMDGDMGGATQHPLFLPPGINTSTFKIRSLTSKTVLFVGSLFMVNNRRAVQWYLDNVHKRLLNQEGYEFHIAGFASPALETKLKTLWALPKVRLSFSPSSLEEVYDQASIFVNPARESAGVKVKVIDAICNGLPVVSTSNGAAGTGLHTGEHLLTADTPQMFSTAIRTLLDDNSLRLDLSTNAQKFLKRNYDMVENLRRIYES